MTHTDSSAMLRRAPDQEAVRDVVEALSAYPEVALKRVADFGTKLEVYDEDGGDEFPNYMPTRRERFLNSASIGRTCCSTWNSQSFAH